MNFDTLSPILQELLINSFETRVKLFLLFGFFIISIMYIFYISPKQKDTNYLMVSTFRVVSYCLCYTWLWLFFFVTPFMLHPQVSVDNLLLLLIAVYSILFMVFFIIFLTNAVVIIPTMFLKLGKYKSIKYSDAELMQKYFFKR